MVSRRRRALKPIVLALVGLVLLAVTGFLAWASVLYDAEPDVYADVIADPAIVVEEHAEALVLRSTSDLLDTGSPAGTGLLFLPGAKVPAEAYASTLSSLVDEGVTVVIAKPILNLAFLDIRPLTAFTGLAPDVSDWYVGGHSLGGVKACVYADSPDVAGLVLLGSYCANDLSSSDIRVLSVAGSEDGLSTPSKVADAADLLPADSTLIEIDGSNHAQFGAYGLQPGDGVANITDVEATGEIQGVLDAFFAG